MSALDDEHQCDFCKKGRVITRKQQLEFRQWTDRGYVHCHVEVPIGLCDHCGSKHWNQEDEAIIEEAVRRECEELPRRDSDRRRPAAEMAGCRASQLSSTASAPAVLSSLRPECRVSGHTFGMPVSGLMTGAHVARAAEPKAAVHVVARNALAAPDA